MASARQNVISLASEVLGISAEKINDGTMLNQAQRSLFAFLYKERFNKLIALDGILSPAIGSIIAQAKKG